MRKYKVAQAVIGCIFLAGFIFHIGEGESLIHNRPQQAGNGFNIPFEAHGGTTYITSLDHFLYLGSFILCFVLAFVLIIIKLCTPDTGE